MQCLLYIYIYAYGVFTNTVIGSWMLQDLLCMPQQTFCKAVPVLSIPFGMPAHTLMNHVWGSSSYGSCFWYASFMCNFKMWPNSDVLVTALTNQNSERAEPESRLQSGSAWYLLAYSFLSFHLLSIKIQIYRTVILSVVLYGYETWSVTFREEHRLMVFENRVLTRIFVPEWEGMTGEWKKWNFRICTVQEILWWSNKGGWDGQGLWHVWGRRKLHRLQGFVRKAEGKRPFGR
jgi:hypothetical protein